MFFGEFEHTIDNKGRLTIPAKFKEALASGIVITRGLDGCLWAFTKDEWEDLAQKVASASIGNQDARQFRRFLFYGAFDAIPDRNGRVIIPQKLRTYAGIETEIVVAGAMDKIELWAPQRWDKEQESVVENPELLAAHLAELGIL